MCGITGVISFTNSPINLQNLVNMTQEIEDRGPDGIGFLIPENQNELCINQKYPQAKIIKDTCLSNFAFAHTRLSIIDLSVEANMPMTDVDNNYWITYNGEIYNHQELRSELIKLGCKFKTKNSDTEVILNAYKKWGIKCLEKLIGMFAFVLYDKTENKFFLVRDRMGVKPFYYTIFNNQLFFSSNLKSLLSVENIPKQLNLEAVNNYFTFYGSPAPTTLVQNFHKIAPANYLEIKEGKLLNSIEYWNILTNERQNITQEEEAIESIYAALEKSVKYRLVADVPIGCMLSGGIDSSANLALMQKFSSYQIKTFSIGFQNSNSYTNELHYAKKVSEFFKSNHHEIIITPAQFYDTYKKVIRKIDEPVYDTATIPIYLLSKHAKAEGINVLFGGEGADELQIGYSLWSKMYRYNKLFKRYGYNSLNLVNNVGIKIPSLKPKLNHLGEWLPRYKNNASIFNGGFNLYANPIKSSIFSTFGLEQLKSKNKDYSDLEYNYFKKLKGTEFLNFMTFMDTRFRLPEVLLSRLDKATMLNGIEARDNFIDHNLAEISMRINPALKIKNNTEKYLLKKAFENILPHEIIYRKKASFNVPINDILFSMNSEADLKNQLLSFNKTHPIFNNDYLSTNLFQNDKAKLFAYLNLTDWISHNKISI